MTATGGMNGAGIGGGRLGNGGLIMIDGGSVTAKGGEKSSGIGGGVEGNGGTIEISNGKVYATGGIEGAGIGGGRFGNGGDVLITGGEVYAQGGAGADDIGAGVNGDAYTNLQISGDAAVFIKTHFNMARLTPRGYMYIHSGLISGASAHGYTNFPAAWEGVTAYGYIPRAMSTCTVAFDTQDSSGVSSQSVDEGEKVSKPSDPTRLGYTFVGWYTTDSCNVDDRWNFAVCTVGEDMTLYAKWTAIPATPTYTITFNAQGGSVVKSQTVDEDEKVSKPSDPTRSGYTFGGWYTSSNCNDDERWSFALCTVGENMTLYAKWTAIPVTPTYTVTFDAQGGSGISSQSVVEDEKASKPSDPRSGYRFGGWYTSTNCNDGDRWNFAYCSVENNITLYAKWTAITTAPTHTVKFDAQGGSSVGSQTATEDEKASKPINTTRSGYTFGGWYTSTNCDDGDRWNFAYCSVENNITLYAKWTAITTAPTHTVKFDAQGGSSVGRQTVTEDEKASKPINTTRSGYTFGGWYTSSNCNDDDRWNFEYCTVSKDITLYAKWTAVLQEDAYTVTFDAQGGSDVSSETVDEGGKASKPSDSTRTGYSLSGWYTDSDCRVGDQWNFEYCSVSKDITLYAKWIAVPQEADQTETPSLPATPTSEPEVSPKPSTSPKVTITPTVIKENKATDTTTIEIDINALPEGTKKIKLPGGETIIIKGSSGTVQIEISSEDLNKSGAMEIVALDNEETPLSTYNIQIVDDNGQIMAFDADKGWAVMSSVLIWIIICVVGLAAVVFVTYVILKKKRA